MADNSAFVKPDFFDGPPKLAAAFALARGAHGDAVRRDLSLEISHPVLVANILDKFGPREYERALELPSGSVSDESYTQKKTFLKVVALLHDVLEDCSDYKPPAGVMAQLEEQKSKGEISTRDYHQAVYEETEKIYPALKKDFLAKLKAQSPPKSEKEEKDLQDFAEAVYQGVRQLTNGSFDEGKRPYEIDQAKHLSPDIRLVRTIDQLASVYGDLQNMDIKDFCRAVNLEEYKSLLDTNDLNNPTTVFAAAVRGNAPTQQALEEMAPGSALEKHAAKIRYALEKNKGSALKGLDVSRECRGDNHDSPYHELFKIAYNRFRDFYKAAQAGDYEAAQALQHGLDIRQDIEKAKNAVVRVTVNPEEVKHYFSPAVGDITHGIARVTVNDKGNVVGFGVVVSADGTSALLNQRIEDREGALIETHRITLKPRGIEERSGGLRVRDHGIKSEPPISIAEFRRMIGDGIDPQFSVLLDEVAKTYSSAWKARLTQPQAAGGITR